MNHTAPWLSAITLVPVLWLGTLPAQADPSRVKAWLDTARKLSSSGDHDQASLLLRQALAKANRPAAKKSVHKLLKSTDPNLSAYRRAYDLAARELVKQAKVMKRSKWHRLALHTLWEAERLAPKLASYPLASLRRSAGRVYRREASARKNGPVKAAVDHGLTPFDLPTVKHFQWQVASQPITCGKLNPGLGSPVLLFSKPSHTDCVLSVEVKRSNAGPGQAALMFGARSYKDLFIYELDYMDSRRTRILVYYYDGATVQILVNQPVTLTEKQRRTWVKYSVRIQGKQVKFSINDMVIAQHRLSRDAHGMPGFHINGKSPNLDPVQFRNLKTESLTAKSSAPRDQLLAELERAAKLPKDRAEQIVIASLGVMRRLSETRDKPLRQQITQRGEALLQQTWSKYPAYKKACQTAAKALQDLAAVYTAAGWKHSAAAIQADARRLQ